MGFTIDIKGQLKSKADFENVINLSKEFAIINELNYSLFEETTEVLLRIKQKKMELSRL